MNLIEIKQHMMQVKMATLSSLCILFNTDADTLRCRLQHWVNKGKIRQCTKKPACGSRCFKCPTSVTEIYEWVDITPALA
jgi:hypothetical protein